MKVLVEYTLKSIVWAFQKSVEICESTFVSYAMARAKLSIFVILKRNREIALRTNHAIWLFTRLHGIRSQIKGTL